MNADVLTTRAADGIAVITLGSAKRIYFDAEMGDALTEALDGFAGDSNVRVVIVTGGATLLGQSFIRLPAIFLAMAAPNGMKVPFHRQPIILERSRRPRTVPLP